MDYFQGVVTEHLRANRSTFVNTECLIQLDEGDRQLKDRHWFCDAMAVNFKDEAVYLCEITYSVTAQALLSRLQAWEKNWQELRFAVLRDSGAPSHWSVLPWLFLPEARHSPLKDKLAALKPANGKVLQMPMPRITHLESVLPWKYRTWDRTEATLAGDA